MIRPGGSLPLRLLRDQRAKPEAAPQAGYSICLSLFGDRTRPGRVTFNGASQSCHSDIATDPFIHFNADEPPTTAIDLILREHGMARRAASGKRVEDDGIAVCPELQYQRNKRQRLGTVEQLLGNKLLELVAADMIVAGDLMSPDCDGHRS